LSARPAARSSAGRRRGAIRLAEWACGGGKALPDGSAGPIDAPLCRPQRQGKTYNPSARQPKDIAMLKMSLIAASLAGLALCTQPAAARPATTAPASVDRLVLQRSVPYADLDLSTAEGQARLDARLRHAAAAVCEANSGPHPLTEVMAARRCYREALQSARRTMASLGATKVAAR